MQDGQKSVSGPETTFTISVVFPGLKPVRAIKEEFHRIAGFLSVISCIDGTHIPITAPSHSEADYVNRKSIHSINVQESLMAFCWVTGVTMPTQADDLIP
ncbi:putative nuclease HARBI1 isoform X2 [Amphiprion ocellaris]|uniref:putative nuclease HARBI1 isoform X2 n=1 Tax=Amphiprion ocellaris TaxID=80972 RepID=UPI002410EB28|nr:putative nuclease HARBI1 isoform X2 [Amphiprion ocellaris]